MSNIEDWSLKNLSITDPVGSSVSVSLGDTTIKGVVFTVDVQNSTLFLENESNGFIIISIPGIKSITVLDHIPKKQTRSVFNLPTDKLIARESKAISLAQVENSKIGIGVSKFGQDIFDELSKTLPTVWSKTDIIVMEDILICDPYSPESCKIINSRQGLETSLVRVQKVLAGIHIKLHKN